jgi:hypothetical protein
MPWGNSVVPADEAVSAGSDERRPRPARQSTFYSGRISFIPGNDSFLLREY